MENHENARITVLGCYLQKVNDIFKDVLQEFHTLKIEVNDYKQQYFLQKKQCESKSCQSSQDLKEMLSSKENTMQLVASTLIQLQETKNLNIVSDVFKIICGEVTLTPPKESASTPIKIKVETLTQVIKSNSETFTDKSLQNESLSEIEGTPTGRTSPIIPMKKDKTRTNVDSKENIKKKCSSKWPTSQEKLLKLSHTSTPTRIKGKSKLRQSKLELVKNKPKLMVDLTGSPDIGREVCTDVKEIAIKMEPTDNDDTFIPSPCGRTHNGYLVNDAKIAQLNMLSDQKVQIKEEITSNHSEAKMNTSIDMDDTHIDASLNLFQPFRFKKPSPKQPTYRADEDLTHFDVADKISIMECVDQLEKSHKITSPKRPLVENVNINNVPTQDTDASISLLNRDVKVKRNVTSDVTSPPSHVQIKRSPEKKEAIFKEPTVRKKAEKRALPGWSCDQCRIFYNELYEDNPEMLLKLMQECTKHRGKNNPIRPKTPPGYWQPRWDVPTDTEEFNKRNNAV